MPSIASWSALEFTANDGSTVGAGSLDVPVIVAAQTDAQVYKQTLVLAQNASGTLWLSTVGPSDFTYLEIRSNVGDGTNGWVILELTTDVDGSIGTELATVPVMAGVPFVLASSVSYANYTANFAGGTLDKIQRIRVKNLNTADATVTINLIY